MVELFAMLSTSVGPSIHEGILALLSGLLVCPLFFFPGCVCCPCIKNTCIRCTNNEAPCEFQAVIVGVTNGTCTTGDCNRLNATWLFTWLESVGNGDPVCTYESGIASPVCGSLGVLSLRINRSGTARFYSLSTDPVAGYQLAKAAGTDQTTSCLNISGEVLNGVGIPGLDVCTTTGGTATITGL